MTQLVVVSLFCEDIRQEANGQKTIVGTFTDSITVPKIPGAFPKLAIYSRLNVPIDFKIEKISYQLLDPDGDIIAEQIVPKELIESNHIDAKSKNHPMYGFISELKMNMLTIKREGVYSVISELNDEKFTSGFLKVNLKPDE